MRNLLASIFFTVLSFNTIFSQTVTAFSHLQEQTFEIETPDSLFVVYGDRIESKNHLYVGRDYTLLELDILLTYHPGTCRIFEEFAGQTSQPKRINLAEAVEVFFAEDFTQGFDLNNQEKIFHITERQIFFKNKVVNMFEIKTIKLIFLDEFGDQITSSEYYEKKFYLHRLVKALFKS